MRDLEAVERLRVAASCRYETLTCCGVCRPVLFTTSLQPSPFMSRMLEAAENADNSICALMRVRLESVKTPAPSLIQRRSLMSLPAGSPAVQVPPS